MPQVSSVGGLVVQAADLWSGVRDSNPRHLAWEANTLPTELTPRGSRRLLPRTGRRVKGWVGPTHGGKRDGDDVRWRAAIVARETTMVRVVSNGAAASSDRIDGIRMSGIRAGGKCRRDGAN